MKDQKSDFLLTRKIGEQTFEEMYSCFILMQKKITSGALDAFGLWVDKICRVIEKISNFFEYNSRFTKKEINRKIIFCLQLYFSCPFRFSKVEDKLFKMAAQYYNKNF